MILKLIPVSETLLRYNVQNHFIELQTVIIVMIFVIPLFVDDAEDLGAVLLTELPDCRQSVRAGVDVGYIKDALNIVGILGIKSIDRFASLTNPEIALVPLTHGCTGDGVRSLRSNQQRTMEVILVEGCNCTQQLHPVFRSSAGTLEHVLRHLMQLICTNSHNHSPHFI